MYSGFWRGDNTMDLKDTEWECMRWIEQAQYRENNMLW
jgi:hypothetical protein